MKLAYYRGDVPNFGDDINPFVWSKVLPANFLDEDEADLLLGIGSIIWNGWPSRSLKHIMGSGWAGYGVGVPDLSDGTWNPVFVRGPRTAAFFGLSKEKAICDGAALLRRIELPPIESRSARPVFVPHFRSIVRGRWEEACRMAGLEFVDPTGTPDAVLDKLRRAPLVITEAMHGAIVADAVRTPWIALRPIHAENRMKWYDWSDSLGIDLRWQKLLPSTMLEALLTTTRTAKKFGPRAYEFNRSQVMAPFNAALTYAAARQLSRIARLEPQLSETGRLDGVVDRALERIDAFVRADPAQRLVLGRN